MKDNRDHALEHADKLAETARALAEALRLNGGQRGAEALMERVYAYRAARAKS